MNWTQGDIDRLTQPTPAERTVKARGKIRVPRGLNKTERAYSAHLDVEKRLGVIRWWRFEGMTLKLADDCRFTADFVVMFADGTLELHDTKVIHRGKNGPHIEDDALVKLRTAAEQFDITVKAVWPTPNGEWGSKEF